MARSVSNLLIEMFANDTVKLTSQLEEAIREYGTVLDLLKAVKAGDVDIANVVVTDDGWRVTPPKPEPKVAAKK